MSKKLIYFSAIGFLSKYIKKHRLNFAMFYFGWLFDSILAVTMPILFGVMIDEIVYYQNVDTFVKIALVFVILTVFSCGLYFLIYFQHGYLFNRYTFDIRKDIYEHLQKSDAQFFADNSTGDIINTLQSCSNECMHFVIRNIIHIMNGLMTLAAYSVYLLIIDWRIGLFALCAAPVSVVINAKFGKKIRKYGDDMRAFYGRYAGWIFEILSALRDIRMLGARKRTEDLFEKNHADMFSVNIKSSVSSLTANNIISFTNLAIQLCIFTIAGYAAISGNITIGVLTIIVSFYASITWQIGRLSSAYLDAQNRVSYIQRIYDFMQTPTEDSWKGGGDIDITGGKIEVKGVSFAYNDKTAVFNSLNLTVNQGERFALVGKSGCGKTTLAYMLIGFYRPQAGGIFIDSQNIEDCNLKSIRRNIGLIQQDVLIFDGTIKENILLGRLNAATTEVEDACKSAGLWDFIASLPDGLDTVIGKKGAGLSGGQKQRVAIARVYLKNPKIIIFDEATSSLDSETEESIHEAWNNVLAGRTSIIIAHRQSSVMMCDRAAIIESGRVAEIGNPAEMERESEKFRTLFAIKEADGND